MTVFLIVLAFLAGWFLVVFAAPVGKCGKCKGKRVVRKKSWWDGKGRFAQCPQCKGRGKCPPPGARQVHRLFWSMAGDSLRDRRKAQLKGDGDGTS